MRLGHTRVFRVWCFAFVVCLAGLGGVVVWAGWFVWLLFAWRFFDLICGFELVGLSWRVCVDFLV